MIIPTFDLTLLQEQHLERWGLNTYRSATFLQVPQAYQLAPTLQVCTPKGSSLTLRASDVYGARLKGLASLEPGQNRFPLTQWGEALVTAYREWLTTAYSTRYRYLTTEVQRTWLTQVVILVVTRHLLEDKWARTLRGEPEAFADPWVGSLIGHLALAHRLPGELARLVHHIVRDPAQQHTLIAQFLEDLDVRMQGYPFVQPTLLPSLPEGVRLPLASWFSSESTTMAFTERSGQ